MSELFLKKNAGVGWTQLSLYMTVWKNDFKKVPQCVDNDSLQHSTQGEPEQTALQQRKGRITKTALVFLSVMKYTSVDYNFSVKHTEKGEVRKHIQVPKNDELNYIKGGKKISKF